MLSMGKLKIPMYTTGTIHSTLNKLTLFNYAMLQYIHKYAINEGMIYIKCQFDATLSLMALRNIAQHTNHIK